MFSPESQFPAPVVRSALAPVFRPTAEATSETAMWLAVLQRLQCGAFIIDSAKRVEDWNEIGLQLLTEWLELDGSELLLSRNPDRVTTAFRRFLNSSSLSSGEKSFGIVARDVVRPLVVCRFKKDATRDCCLIIDLETAFQPAAQNLRQLFGLTTTEAKLALAMARGAAPADLAKLMMVRQTTIRSHLASIFAKTGTRRQSELVALLARVSLLP